MYRVLTPTHFSRCFFRALLHPRVAVPWVSCPGVAGLHVFVRHTKGYAEVEVRDDASVAALQKAAIAELGLNMTPDSVRLLLELENGARKALDGYEKLAAQGVGEGARVYLEVPDVYLEVPDKERGQGSLPKPVHFAEESLGGEPWMVAHLDLRLGASRTHPFYLSLEEYDVLKTFLDDAPLEAPQFLLLMGPIKSGKSRLVHEIIPGMLAARYAASPPASRRLPAIFTYKFLPEEPIETSARDFVTAMVRFASIHGLELDGFKGEPMDCFTGMAIAIAEGIEARGGELWMLLDEVGAPIVSSTPRGASQFMQRFKAMVDGCSPCARMVATGSGMVSLLTSIRASRPNGFMLWHAIESVRLGKEPSPAASLAMAQGLLQTYSHQWPPAVARGITPQLLVQALAQSAHSGITSPRPALLAYLLSFMGRGHGGAPEKLLAKALKSLLLKLNIESTLDAAVALERMDVIQLRVLRVLADGGGLPEPSNPMHDFAEMLCEPQSIPCRLLPPYGFLVRNWITPSGQLTVSSFNSRVELSSTVRANLKALFSFETLLQKDTLDAISAELLYMMACNGIGVRQPLGGVKAPSTVKEVEGMQAVASILKALKEERAPLLREGKPIASQSSEALQKALRADPHTQKQFMSKVGFTILIWVRHLDAHVFASAIEVHQSGLTCAVVGELVNAAVEVILEKEGKTFGLNKENVLCIRG